MKTSRLCLLALLCFTAGCRELGQYLPNDQVKSCLDGTRTEDCPDALLPTATATFALPAIAPGVLNESPTSRFAAIQAAIVSTLVIDRVDLQCAGLQLASWRPGRVQEAALTGTVDLLPCRTSSIARDPDGDGVVLHEVPLEVAVFDPLGARVMIEDLNVLANLADTQLPGVDAGSGPNATRLSLSLGLASGLLAGVLPAGVPLDVEIRSTSGSPLVEAPELRVNGVRQEVAFTSPDRGVVWTGRLAGVRPRPTTGGASSLAELLDATRVVISAVGTAEGGSAGIRQQTYALDRDGRTFADVAAYPAWVEYPERSGPSIREPVATTAGTLVIGDMEQAILFGSDGSMTDIAAPSLGGFTALAGLTAQGGILWQTFDGLGDLTGNHLQPDLSTAPSLRLLPQLDAGSENKVRLGNGAICQEQFVPSPNVVCGSPPTAWSFSCIGPGGASSDHTAVLAAPSLVPTGGATVWAPLAQGWISSGYEVDPTCAAPQAAGKWGTGARQLAFASTYQAPRFAAAPVFIALTSGPNHAVIGHQDDLRTHLERLNGETGVSDGTYFGSREGLLRPSASEILFALPDGAVLTLSPNGVLSRWLPGASDPVTFNLFAWAGGDLGLPPAMRPDVWSDRRLVEIPHVAHANGNVTFALLDQANQPLVLEVDSMLRPVWAWRSPALTDGPFAVYGVPDHTSVDLVLYVPTDGRPLIRLAR